VIPCEIQEGEAGGPFYLSEAVTSFTLDSPMQPLLTLRVLEQLRGAASAGAATVKCSLDLQRSTTTVEVDGAGWSWNGQRFPYPDGCKDRTVYYWDGETFEPAARYTTSLVKLVPTDWGPPTFEIDGIKMLPTARVSPYADAEDKVSLIRPRGKVILDTCGGLGYFAACCLQGEAKQVLSYEKNLDVIWLRSLNPWSPEAGAGLSLTHADIAEQITGMPDESMDAILHDPPRFAIAGELYSQRFYTDLARVLKRKGKLFHYTGTPNKLTSHRDVPNEVAKRLRQAGFAAQLRGDGVLAVKG
jgi:predicted methyltransferase